MLKDVENVLKLELERRRFTKLEKHNISENILKNNVKIKDGIVYNQRVNNWYKKIDLSTAFTISVDPNKEFTSDWLFNDIYNQLGESIYNVYCGDRMSICDFIKINTISPKFLGNRSAFDFYYNMINSWYFESSIKKWFSYIGYVVSDFGNDLGYMVVSSSMLKSDYDFILYNMNTKKRTNIEFIDDFKGLTSKCGFIPLRENKLKNIKKFGAWIVILNHHNKKLYMIAPDSIESEDRKVFNYQKSHVVYINDKTYVKNMY